MRQLAGPVADYLFMVRKKHPIVVDRIFDALNGMDELESTRSAVAVHHLAGVLRFRSSFVGGSLAWTVPDHVTRKIVT